MIQNTGPKPDEAPDILAFQPSCHVFYATIGYKQIDTIHFDTQYTMRRKDKFLFILPILKNKKKIYSAIFMSKRKNTRITTAGQKGFLSYYSIVFQFFAKGLAGDSQSPGCLALITP